MPSDANYTASYPLQPNGTAFRIEDCNFPVFVIIAGEVGGVAFANSKQAAEAIVAGGQALMYGSMIGPFRRFRGIWACASATSGVQIVSVE